MLLSLLCAASSAQTASPTEAPSDIKKLVLAYAHTRPVDLRFDVPKQRYGETEKPEPRYLTCEPNKLASTLQRVTDAYQLQDALNALSYSKIAIGVLSKCMAAGYFGDIGSIIGEDAAAKRVREMPLSTYSLFLANNLFFEQEVSKVLGMPISKTQLQHAKRLATWAGENGANATSALERINAFKP